LEEKLGIQNDKLQIAEDKISDLEQNKAYNINACKDKD
jgi:hypothetical protein